MVKKVSPKKRLMDLVNYGPNGCWQWQGARTANKYLRYGQFWFKGRSISAHRASWRIFHGEIPQGLCVLHRCDVPTCVNPDHLFLGTQMDNAKDMQTKGRDRYGVNPKRGVAMWNHRLVPEQVIAIRNDDRANQIIAAEYGIDASAISRIKTRKRWTHI